MSGPDTTAGDRAPTRGGAAPGGPHDEGALFTYAVTPASVHYSDASVSPVRWNTVSLTITATNQAGRFVPCPRIAFTVGLGSGQGALTNDPSTVGTAPGPRTPWFVGGGEGRWVALPLPPATGLAAGEQVSFQLHGVVVNTVPGPVSITIEEHTDRVRETLATLTKEGRAPIGGIPTIGLFTATPAEVAYGGFAQLTWAVADAAAAEVLPGPIPLADPAGGSLTLPVTRSTIFRLRATGPGGQAEADAVVAVAPVSIGPFTADPPESSGPGAPVWLDWSTRFASHCAIDQGVGPVPTGGRVEVRPDRTTVYTLTASGLQPRSAAVTVTVDRPAP